MNQTLTLFYLVIATMISGCVTYQQIELDPKTIVNTQLAVGDSVSVKTFSDQQYSFTITKIDGVNLYGENLVVAISDIKSLDKQPKSEVSPLWIVLLFLLIWLNHDLSSGFDCIDC